MVKRVAMCAVAIFFVATVAMSRPNDTAKTGSWSGWVTNDMCGAADGPNAKGAECTTKCVKEHGAKYALYDKSSKKVYVLDPQDKAAAHAGHEVTVKGTLDGDTLHVASISMSKGR